MGTISAVEVQNLNKKIEAINTAKTRAEAKVDMLKKTLSEQVSAYEKEYGVSLSGVSLGDIQLKVDAELKSVSAELEKEYSLKLKVVEAIERGDYDTANELMGVKPEADAELSNVVEEPIEEVTEVKPTEETISKESVTVGADDFDFGFDEDESESKSEPKESWVNIADGVSDLLEDDSESDEIEIGDSSESSVSGADFLSSVANSIGNATESKVESAEDNSSDFGGFVVEDDEEEDYGFGELLSGSKFSL